MKITVIAGRKHYNLEDYTVRALESLGHEVQFLGFNEVNGKKYSDLIRMASTRSYVIRKGTQPFWLDSINKKYTLNLSKFRPEIVLSIKGESVLPKTLRYIEEELHAQTALWSPDDPRFFRSLFSHIAPLYDSVFSYSSDGVEKYRDLGIENAFRLPFGCDNSLHSRDQWNNKPIDRALFVGTFTPKRYRILYRVIKAGVKVDIAGKYWKRFLPSNTISEGIYGKHLSEMFQKYKVSINMHNDERYGPNMRNFEVTGSGGVLMTDMAEDTSSFFREGKEAIFYQDVQEMIKLLKDVIAGGDSIMDMARNGYSRCHRFYTYVEVMRNLLKIMSG